MLGFRFGHFFTLFFIKIRLIQKERFIFVKKPRIMITTILILTGAYILKNIITND